MSLDPRIAEGMRAQLALRHARLDAGERPLGWKVGFGSPAAMARLGIDRPLVGFLTDAGLLEDGAEVAVGGWVAPLFEAEIAVRVGRDVPGDATVEDVRAAVAGLAAAVELADLHPQPDDVATILAGDVFHRHVLLGPFDSDRRDGAGVVGRVLRDGAEIAATDDPAAATGDVLEVVRLTAELLSEVGETLRAGEVVITGAVVPPIPVAPGERLTAELSPLGSISVALA